MARKSTKTAEQAATKPERDEITEPEQETTQEATETPESGGDLDHGKDPEEAAEDQETPQETPEDGDDEDEGGDGEDEDEGEPEEAGEPDMFANLPDPCVYCGPSVKNVAKQYTTYQGGGIPDALRDFIKAHPAARGLLVSTSKFAAVRRKLETPGTAEAILYKSVKSEL